MTGQLKFLLKFFFLGAGYILLSEAAGLAAGYYFGVTWTHWILSMLLLAALIPFVPALNAGPIIKGGPTFFMIFICVMFGYIFMLPPDPSSEAKEYRFFERSQFASNLNLDEAADANARFISFREGILDYNLRETYREDESNYEAIPLLRTEENREEPVQVWLVCRYWCSVGIPLHFQVTESFAGAASPYRNAVSNAMRKHRLETHPEARIVSPFPNGGSQSEALGTIAGKIKGDFFWKLGFWIICHAAFTAYLLSRREKNAAVV